MLALLEEKHLLSSETPVSDIAAFVQQTGQYDTEVETYPGDDYALCFLTEMQRGYCVHFATAAAALYRAAGIPARVTEGFLVHSIAGRMMDVKGSDAHAWVEIYQDGLGWIPVEVTGQSGLKADPDGEEPAEVQKVEAETTSSPSPSEENPDIMSASQDIKAPEPEEHAASAAATPSPSPSPSLQLPVGIISDPFSSAESESSRLSLLWLLLLPV